MLSNISMTESFYYERGIKLFNMRLVNKYFDNSNKDFVAVIFID